MGYDVFISYSRAADEEFAVALRTGLQQLGKAWNKRRALNVFLDQASLEASAGLESSLERDLDSSRYFVLLASPESARSKWANQELAYWLGSRGSSDELRIVLTAGEIVWDEVAGDFDADRSTAIGEGLVGVFSEEPLWLDMRWAKSQQDLDLRRNPRFSDDVATLAAPMHEISKEELVGVDLDQFRRSTRLRRAAVSGLAVLTAIAGLLALLSLQNAERANTQASIAKVNEERANSEAERANTQASIALVNEGVANENSRRAQARELAAAATSNLGDDPELSILLALHSAAVTSNTDGYILRATEQAIHDAVVHSRLRQTLTGHRVSTPDMGYSVAGGVAFSADGERIATATRDNEIHLWERDGPTGMWQPGTVLQASGDINGLAFSPLGLLASADQSGAITVWDASGADLASLAVLNGGAGHLAFSRDGKLAAGASDGATYIWSADLIAGRLATDTGDTGGPSPAVNGPRHTREARGLEFSSDGTLVASTDWDGRLKVWTATSGTIEADLFDGSSHPCQAVAFIETSVVAQGCGDGVVRLWDIPSEALLTKFHGHDAGLHRLDTSRDGRLLASASADWTVKVWDVTTRTESFTLSGHKQPVVAVAFSPDDLEIVSTSHDGTARVWAVASSEEFTHRLAVPPQLFHSVAITGDNRIVTTDDGTVRSWDARTGEEHARVANGGFVTAVAADGNGVLSGDATGAIRLWPSTAGSADFEPVGEHGARIADIAFNEDRRLVASAGDQRLLVWDTENGFSIELPTGDADEYMSVDLSDDGRLVGAGSWNSHVVVWDITNLNAPALKLDSFDFPSVTGVAFNPTKRHLAVSGTDGSPLVWNLDRGEVEFSLVGHTDWVLDIAYSRDGTRLATASRDKTTRVWDAGTGEELLVLTGHDSQVSSVAFSPDGSRLATTGAGGEVRMYVLDTWDLLELAQGRVTRSLTSLECQEFLHVETCPPSPSFEAAKVVVR